MNLAANILERGKVHWWSVLKLVVLEAVVISKCARALHFLSDCGASNKKKISLDFVTKSLSSKNVARHHAIM